MRFFRGLFLGLSLSVLNLAGMFLMLLVLSGLGAWSTTQFVGVFGIFEVATGMAFIYCPNAWRLPVVEVEAKRTDVHLTASTLFIPHWAGGAKVLAGAAMVAYAGARDGVDTATLGILPFAFAIAVLTLAVSAIAAAWGTRNPSADVLYFKIERPGKADIALPGLSLSAAALQILLGAFTLPTIKLLSPGAFFSPEIGPSLATLVASFAAAAAAVLVSLLVWRGRMAWRARPEQQRLAEQPA
jgi:hypothetical protein